MDIASLYDRDMTESQLRPRLAPSPLSSLSARERQVLEMVSSGLTNPQIAERLAVTVHAVKFHLASIYRKLHVANRTEAAVTFHRANEAQ